MPYLGEIRMFAGNFAPAGWKFCQGQSISISEYETLFQLIGTTYGGDGQETFDLPDLQGRGPVHMGQGPGLSQAHQLGERFGTEQVTITQSTTPAHTHPFQVGSSNGSTTGPEGNVLHQPTDTRMFVRDVPAVALPARTIGAVGGSQPHDNMPPVLAVSFIISLFGVYPVQS